MTVIPLGLILTEIHDILILFVICHDMYICCMGLGFVMEEELVLVAVPHILI